MKSLMKEMKIGFKMVKYGIQYKQQSVIAVIFAVLGIAFIVLGGPAQILLGMMYMTICGTYFTQPYISTSISSCVASSPLVNGMFSRFIVVFNALAANTGYAIGVACIAVKYVLANVLNIPSLSTSYTLKQVAAILIMSGLLSMGMQVYAIICNKWFVISMIFFFVFFFSLYFYMSENISKEVGVDINIFLSGVIGLACIWVGTVLSYFVAKLTRRIPLDNWYYKRNIASALK